MMVLRGRVTLCYSLDLLFVRLGLLGVNARKVWSNTISVECLSHVHLVGMDWLNMFVVGSDCL